MWPMPSETQVLDVQVFLAERTVRRIQNNC